MTSCTMQPSVLQCQCADRTTDKIWLALELRFWSGLGLLGKTAISILHDAQLLLNKQQHVYIR